MNSHVKIPQHRLNLHDIPQNLNWRQKLLGRARDVPRISDGPWCSSCEIRIICAHWLLRVMNDVNLVVFSMSKYENGYVVIVSGDM